ncbi:MAG: GNAT family N-acetyltransferase [Granulosicoccaceae bacterium]
MSKYTIRRAKLPDSVSLSDCINAAYSVYEPRITDLLSVSDGIVQSIESDRVWVAETEQGVVGGIILSLRDEFIMLENIAVHPDNSAMGIGAALIKRAELDCLELGFFEMRLSTHIDMPENVRLYEHLGWQETGRMANKIHMSKYF